MTIRLTSPGGWRQSLMRRILAGALLVALPMVLSSPSMAAKKPPIPKVVAAATVPIPHLSPRKAIPAAGVATASSAAPAPSGDTIGTLIARDDSNEATATDDSDAPESNPSNAIAALPPAPPPVARPGSEKPINATGLKLALGLLDNNDPAGAAVAIYTLPDPTDIKIVNWLIATGGYPSIPSASLAGLRQKLPDWPSQALMRLRYEQAVAREKPPAADVIKALGTASPASDSATLLLAAAYIDVGRKDDAATLISNFWRQGNFSEATEKSIVSDFAGLLRSSDHKARMDRLLYADHGTEALRTAKFLDKDQLALAQAVALVIKESSKAKKALEALSAAAKHDPLYTYARIKILRRAGGITEAGTLLAAAPRDPAVIVDPDAWWVERRLVSRALIGIGNPKLAYEIAANHSAESATLRAEAEFHAGWYALEYLGDPATAEKHFTAIAAISTMPLSVSRAEYWLGRAYTTAGSKDSAKAHFQRAGAYPTTFYGQLALVRLGEQRLSISPPPVATADTVVHFNSREFVQVIRHLIAAGHPEYAGIFFRTLGDTLNDPAEVALLTDMAEQAGEHQIALQIGKSAAVRGLPVQWLAFPTAAIPASTSTPNVEKPLVYAIARQESAFNPGAISGAGARGLLQLMPATAKEIAKGMGVTYSKARLTSDPGYNAMLGASHLGDLVDSFGGSYVMTFAAYNAGASRVAEWVKQNGDPRDPKVDVVNWIELIPFTETRNYVQRIMENLQVYRARLGSPALVIEADLKRGGPR
jgi:soluble lytic murein transglycosylase